MQRRGVVVANDAILDPYHGLRESWSAELLNAASQSPPSGIVFDHAVVRQAPATNQIALPDRAHLEACGPVAMAISAYACGLIDDPVAAAIRGCAWIGDDTVAKFGTDTAQLIGWAAHEGWPVHADNRPAGELDADWAAHGLIGVMALDTAYGTGALWNTLHPQAQGRIGHWEVGGNVNATMGGYAMDAAKETSLDQFDAWVAFVLIMGRQMDSPTFNWGDSVTTKTPSQLIWDLLQSPEFTDPVNGGGLLGHIARQDAALAHLTAQLSADEQAALGLKQDAAVIQVLAVLRKMATDVQAATTTAAATP
jgi:hypothetical protein